jgi:Na+-driven multidrug efflux pump
MQPLLSSPGVLRPLLALALPVLIEETLNLLVGWTDWWLAGWFIGGDDPLAAMGLLAYLMWLIPSFFSFVGIGATAVVARAAARPGLRGHCGLVDLWWRIGVCVGDGVHRSYC